MPTGGVSPTKENLESWFNAGATCVGMGSKLMVKDSNGNFDYKRIEELTKFSVDLISELKNK